MSHYVEYKRSDLKAGHLGDFTYYLKLVGYEVTSGQIRVNVFRKGSKEVKYSDLLVDTPLKLIIEAKSTAYFSFSSQYETDSTIIAKSDAGIQMFLGVDK